MTDQVSKWASTHHVQARVLFCTLRSFSREQSLETARLALDFQGAGVVGLDMGGDEAGFALEAHLPAFKLARAEALCCTVHAGEASGPESVREVLREVTPARIGHGVRAIEDPELVLVCLLVTTTIPSRSFAQAESGSVSTPIAVE